jgi:hypothetical protein
MGKTCLKKEKVIELGSLLSLYRLTRAVAHQQGIATWQSVENIIVTISLQGKILTT